MTQPIDSKYLPEGWVVYFDGFEWVSDTGDGPAAHEADDPMSDLFDHLAMLEEREQT